MEQVHRITDNGTKQKNQRNRKIARRKQYLLNDNSKRSSGV